MALIPTFFSFFLSFLKKNSYRIFYYVDGPVCLTSTLLVDGHLVCSDLLILKILVNSLVDMPLFW